MVNQSSSGETQGTLADLTYINPLTGKLKDFKTSKLGQYKISLIVTDTEGLTGEAVEIIDVAPDLDPIASNTANSRATRELSDGGLATYTIEGTVMSIDQDIISKRFWYFSYDANNDKSFNDAETTTAIDEEALIIGWEYTYMAGSEPLIVTKTNAHILTLKGKHVGGYQWRLQGIEIPGQPTDLRY